INEVVKRQYEIGENFLTKSSKGWLGVSVYDFVNHPSIEIFKKIVDKVPYSPYASSAQYKLGVLYVKLGRFDDAVDEFQKVIDNYPDTEWAAPARYQLAIATSKSSYGNQYDSTALDEARKRLEEFIELHPDADISLDASKQLDSMRQREAAKNFETAEFYEKQLKFEAAILYYQIVVSDYKDSLLFDSASKSISEINFLLKQGLSPKEIFRRRKKSLVESNVLKEKVKELK
ncbi:MAG: outer membrane protein assembly factor BamD, partial [Candidatus Omnitrophica bacterium]|nr:outer membrane protein assembly factor BamD [Candidatus Omnitrophota bacterium]